MSRPPKYATHEERLVAIRAQTRKRVKRWRRTHPRKWTRIVTRHRAKRRKEQATA